MRAMRVRGKICGPTQHPPGTAALMVELQFLLLHFTESWKWFEKYSFEGENYTVLLQSAALQLFPLVVHVIVLLPFRHLHYLTQNYTFLKKKKNHWDIMSANMAHTYLLQLLSPAISLGGIRIVGKQLSQRVLQLLHFARVLSQLGKQSLQEDNKEEQELTEAAILMLFSNGTYDRALWCH